MLTMDMICTLICFGWCVLAVLADDSQQPRKAGTVGQSVKLPCSIGPLGERKVRWEDTVYAMSPEPVVIFRSQDNPNFVISDNHSNRANYKVDRNNFDLKISNLQFDDVGKYSCVNEANASQRADHYLEIHDALKCSGETNLQEGQTTTLRCELAYSGSQPSLKWFRAGQEVESVDRSDLLETPVAAKEVNVSASHSLDGQTFRCHMTFADRENDCIKVLNVTYSVRDVVFRNATERVHVGDEVTCTARGNPAPEISVIPANLPERTDAQKKSSVFVRGSWEGKDVTLNCTATNTVRGKVYRAAKSITFHVTAPPPTTTTTSKPKVTEKSNPANKDSKGVRSADGATLLLLVSWTTFFYVSSVHRC